MSEIVIRAENLGKKYRIQHHHERQRYVALRDVFADKLFTPRRWLVEQRARRNGSKGQSAKRQASSPSTFALNSSPSALPPLPRSEDFWALRGISFEIKQGEAVGIIGRNGAGKSTLLKVLSRITEPTEGQVGLKGRVVSLLEVGTGFHPELTGRENAFLNGAILGMTKAEIKKKFDEIVAFAEIEKFLDTPVKRYSSGMYIRLAFAVAAHLEPEILLVDEVLAVGDAAFQKKCLGKMEDVAKEGRTVLFVSHNMHAASNLCQRAILLQNGRITDQGPARLVIEQYLSSGADHCAKVEWNFQQALGDESVKLHSISVLDEEGQITYDGFTGRPIILQIEFWCLRKTQVTASFHIYNRHGIMLFSTGNLHDQEWGQREYDPGLYRCWCAIPSHFLNEGQYYVNAYLSRDTDGSAYVQVPEAVSFQVLDDGSGRGNYIGPWPGVVRPLLNWKGSRLNGLS